MARDQRAGSFSSWCWSPTPHHIVPNLDEPAVKINALPTQPDQFALPHADSYGTQEKGIEQREPFPGRCQKCSDILSCERIDMGTCDLTALHDRAHLGDRIGCHPAVINGGVIEFSQWSRMLRMVRFFKRGYSTSPRVAWYCLLSPHPIIAVSG